MRVTRFQRALRLFERLDSPPRGTHTAAAGGYADHARFIRDFVEFAGYAPGAHLLRAKTSRRHRPHLVRA